MLAGLGRARNLASQSRSARAESGKKPSSAAADSTIAASGRAAMGAPEGRADADTRSTMWGMIPTAIRHTLRMKRRIKNLLPKDGRKYIALKAHRGVFTYL